MELDVDSPQQQQLLQSDYDVEVAMEGDGEKKILYKKKYKCFKFYLLEGRRLLRRQRLLEGLARQSSEVCGSAGGAGNTGRGRVLRRVVELVGLGLLEDGRDGNCWRGQNVLEGQRVLKRLSVLERYNISIIITTSKKKL